MVKLILFLFIQLSVFRLSAQSILVTGKILDAETRNPIANATIKSGNFGTSSIKDGSFRMVLNKELTSNLGLTISCIGYETKTIAYKENLQIFLNSTNQVLNEVIVGVSGLSILEKAIQNIEKKFVPSLRENFAFFNNLKISFLGKIPKFITLSNFK